MFCANCGKPITEVEAKGRIARKGILYFLCNIYCFQTFYRKKGTE